MRHYSVVDKLIHGLDKILQGGPRPDAASLMRVNHSGEVCAQALYKGQAFVAKDPRLAASLEKAALEEQTHLAWCAKRIEALGGRTSYLNPLWAVGSFSIGMMAGLGSDKISLGFLAETEYQVVKHLDKHLRLLPKDDEISRSILLKMKEDELRHANDAMGAGGISLPFPIRVLMNCVSKIMTVTSRYI